MGQKEQAKMNEITSNFGEVKTTQTAGNPANDVIPISELLLTARRQLLPVAICVGAGLVASVLHYATTPPKYYAAASVMIEERTSDLVEELTASLPSLRNDTAVLNEMQVIHSLHLAEVVAREILSNHTLVERTVDWLVIGSCRQTESKQVPKTAVRLLSLD